MNDTVPLVKVLSNTTDPAGHHCVSSFFCLCFFAVSSALVLMGSRKVLHVIASPAAATNTTRFDEFKKFVKKKLRPATADIGKLADANRKHVQKL